MNRFLILIFICCGMMLQAQHMPFKDATRYKDIPVGKKQWHDRNLNTTTFRNGEAIPQAKSPAEWAKFAQEGKAAWCYYQFDPKQAKTYGKLYNGYAVKDSRGLAPVGYHISTEAEWKLLLDLAGSSQTASRLRASMGWSKPGVDSLHLSFDPSGAIRNQPGPDFSFTESGTYAAFWTPAVVEKIYLQAYVIAASNEKVEKQKTSMAYGYSVRCVKD